MTPELTSMLADSAAMFVRLFVELSLLFLVISYLVALVNQKLPAERIQRLLGAREGRGYLTAAGLGAVTPFCSCSTIPMLIGLLKARAGFGPTMTFLFTSPLLNPIVVALFIPVLGLEFTLWYAALALGASMVAGVLLERFGFERYVRRDAFETGASACDTGCASEETPCCDEPPAAQASCCGEPEIVQVTCCGTAAVAPPSTWRLAWHDSWALFRSMFPYMVVAMLIGAVVHGFVPADFFARVASADNPAAVPTAALVGIPLYVRVTTLLPLVGPFVAKGVSLGAVVALVIGSGGASLPEVIMLKRLFLWPLIIAFLGVIFGMAVIGGYAFNLFLA
jgi:uncharacterized membrane protein YraQ (UPF0718 family)